MICRIFLFKLCSVENQLSMQREHKEEDPREETFDDIKIITDRSAGETKTCHWLAQFDSNTQLMELYEHIIFQHSTVVKSYFYKSLLSVYAVSATCLLLVYRGVSQRKLPLQYWKYTFYVELIPEGSQHQHPCPFDLYPFNAFCLSSKRWKPFFFFFNVAKQNASTAFLCESKESKTE